MLEILGGLLFVGNRLFVEMEFWIRVRNVITRTNLAVVQAAKSMQVTNATHLQVHPLSVGSVVMVLSNQDSSATTKIKLAVQWDAK